MEQATSHSSSAGLRHIARHRRQIKPAAQRRRPNEQTFGDPTFLTPPNDFEDLTLQLTMELEDTLRDGIGIPYVPPPPIRSKDEAAALRKASEKSDKSRDKKGKSRDKKKSNGNVDIEDLDGGMGNAESGPSGSGAGALYAQGGIGPDQEAFFGWRIPDARRVVGVGESFVDLLE